MTHARGRLWVALVVAAIMVVSSAIVIGGVSSPANRNSPSAPAATAPSPTMTATPSTTAPTATPFGIDAGRAATVAADEAALAANGYTSSQFLPPNLHQAPPLAQTGGVITPLYSVAPAPTGVAYYGLSDTGSGVQATTVNTTALQATFSTTDPLGVETESFDFGTQTAYGAQLNAVLTNVTLFGQTSFGANPNAPTGCTLPTGPNCLNEFWLQNVINYNTATHSLSFENNIWNFSNPEGAWSSGTNAVQGFSTPRGGFYAVNGPSITINYPFTIALYLNTTRGPCHLDSVAGTGVSSCGTVSQTAPVNEVFFNYTVWNSLGQRVCPTNPGTGKVCGEYDDVFFNSVSPSVNPGGVPEYGPNGRIGSATIQANGSAYDPLGLTNDYEMDWGIGSSSGATASVVYANATVGINYCQAANTALSGKCNAFSATPAAYDYGGETGETNDGAISYWAPQGGLTGPIAGSGPTLLPGAGTPVAHFVTGPSLLLGLWNGSGSSYPTGAGGNALNYVHISPANAWVGIAAGANVTNQSEFQVAPTFGWFSGWTGSGGSPTGTLLGRNLFLPPDQYTVEVELSGYNPYIGNVDLRTSGQAPTISLTHNLGTGVYTPLWAYSNSDLANISVNYGAFGLGGPSAPYMLQSAAPTVGAPFGESGSMSWLFSNLNDYLFTTWIGEYINSTTSYAESNPGPSFLMEYPSWQLATLALFDVPTYDQFQFYYFHVQNFTLAGTASIYAWANSQATTVYSVVCNACHNDLFADNNFAVSDRGMEFINGGTALPVGNALLNTRNVVWGNTFTPDPQPTYAGLITPTTGLILSEAYDRVFNNAFYTNGTASAAAADATWWNVTCQLGYAPLTQSVYPGSTVCQSASFVTSYLGFSLTGSILGTAYQGGNFWFNYGNVANPYGNLPYDARSSSITGSPAIASTSVGARGDYAPLITYSVYDPIFFETGISSSSSATAFEVRITGAPGSVWFNETATNAVTNPTCSGSPCLVFYLPSGTYSYDGFSGLTGASAVAANPATGTFTISGAPYGTVTTFAFGTSYAVTFTETGLPAHTPWSISIPSEPTLTSTTTTIVFNLPNGAYTYTIANVPGYTTTYTGGFTVSGAAVPIAVTFTQTVYAVTFTESGLPYGAAWTIAVSGQSPMTTTVTGVSGTTQSINLPNGTYTYTVATNDSTYAPSSYSGGFTVAGAPVSQSVTFTEVTYGVSYSESGLPSGKTWSVTFNGVTNSMTTDGLADTLTFAAEPNGTYAYSIAGVPGYSQSTVPYTGSESVSGAAVAVSVTFTQVTYGVTFSESGLPSGQTWMVTFDGTPMSLTTDGGTDTLTFASVPNGTYAYSIADVAGWHQSSIAYSGNENVNGGSLNVAVTFTQVTYTVTFSESGLPSGQNWAVTVNGVTMSLTTDGATDTLTWTGLTNGSYSYSVADVSGWHQTTLPYAGSISVNGGTAAVDGTGNGYATTLAYSAVVYAVTFSESTLPSGLNWRVTVNAVTQSLTTNGGTDTLSFSDANGTYSYAIADISGWHQSTLPYTGTLVVNGGTGPIDGTGVGYSVTLAYSQEMYSVKFRETGLPPGTSWSVTIGNTTLSSTSTQIVFTLPNGTYAWSVANVANYSRTPTGSVAVAGTGVTVTEKFKLVTYTVNMKETGLASGTSWSVTIGSTTGTSTSNKIVFKLSNGTYGYTIAPVTGYSDTASGTIVVNGATLTITTHFTLLKYAVTFTEHGLPAHTSWQVTIGANTYSGTGTTITVHLADGTYGYSASAPSTSYTAPSGSVTVNGAPTGVSVTFS
jgi:Thermopsin